MWTSSATSGTVKKWILLTQHQKPLPRLPNHNVPKVAYVWDILINHYQENQEYQMSRVRSHHVTSIKYQTSSIKSMKSLKHLIQVCTSLSRPCPLVLLLCKHWNPHHWLWWKVFGTFLIMAKNSLSAFTMGSSTFDCFDIIVRNLFDIRIRNIKCLES